MKKGFKTLFLCIAVVLPVLFLPFMAKAGNKDVKISVWALPNNGTDEKHLMCGSSLIFTVDIDSSEVNNEQANIDWNVAKKDGTAMQAVYEVQNNGKNLEVYAPYGYSEELEVSVCVNGNKALTDTYAFETQENEKMVGKTFFQFDLGSEADHMVCSPTTEVWDANKQTYTITMPYVSHENNGIMFHGWKCFDGNIYDPGAKVTVPRKNGFMPVSAWYDVLDKPEVIATKVPIFTEEPAVTTGVAVTTAPAETAQASAIPSVAPEVTTEPAVSVTPKATEVAEETTIPEITQIPAVTTAPEITQVPAVTNTPEITMEPTVTGTPEMTKEPLASVTTAEPTALTVTGTPEVTKAPEVTGTTEVTQAPLIPSAPQVTKEPVSKTENNRVRAVSKITVKKSGSRKAKVSWSKVSNVKGYRIAYSTNKSFKNNSTKYKTTKATKITLTKLTKNKTYYVKVCAYKVVDGKRVYGTYSNVKKITLK